MEPIGRNGGLALLWKKENELEIQNYSRRHINAIVTRNESWSLLRHLKNFCPQPWLCVRNFNEITYQGEKTGEARQRPGRWHLLDLLWRIAI